MVHVDDALEPGRAEALYRELDVDAGGPDQPHATYEYMAGARPLYQYSYFGDQSGSHGSGAEKTPMWDRLFVYMNTPEVIANFSRATGSALALLADQVTWYKPGNTTGIHNDMKVLPSGHRRRLAYILHLCKDWDDRLGGDLYVMHLPNVHHEVPSHHVVPCRFNSMTLFLVHMRHSHHLVTPVAVNAEEIVHGSRHGVEVSATGEQLGQKNSDRIPKRLAHSGWYYVEGSEEAELREIAPFPAGERNEFGDRWNSVYVDGKVGPDDAGGAAIRLCAAEDAAFCMFGGNARKSDMGPDEPNLDDVSGDRAAGGGGGGVWGGPPFLRVDTRAPLGSAANPSPFRYTSLPTYESETMPVSLDELQRQREEGASQQFFNKEGD